MLTETQAPPEDLRRVSTSAEEAGTSLFDLLLPLAENRRLIFRVTAVVAVAALIVSFFISDKYTAITKILTPQQSQSSVSSMLGQLGALSALGSSKDNLLGLKNPADLYVGILRSRSIADSLIEQFDLKTLYRDKKISD